MKKKTKKCDITYRQLLLTSKLNPFKMMKAWEVSYTYRGFMFSVIYVDPTGILGEEQVCYLVAKGQGVSRKKLRCQELDQALTPNAFRRD